MKEKKNKSDKGRFVCVTPYGWGVGDTISEAEECAYGAQEVRDKVFNWKEEEDGEPGYSTKPGYSTWEILDDEWKIEFFAPMPAKLVSTFGCPILPLVKKDEENMQDLPVGSEFHGFVKKAGFSVAKTK